METIIVLIIIGVVAGILSGLFGIGGGIIIVPALVYFCGFSQLKAQGTSLTVLLPPVGILAFLQYYKKGNVDVKAGAIIIIFLVLGSMVGSRVAQLLPVLVLKRGFGALMIFIAVKMILTK